MHVSVTVNWVAVIEKAQSLAPTKAHVDLLAEALRQVGKERDDALRRCEELEARLLRLERPTEMVEYSGLLWKRTTAGFEQRPYCPECNNHPVMMGFPPGSADMWACPANHTFDYAIKPPTP
jgi:hypothetical protein